MKCLICKSELELKITTETHLLNGREVTLEYVVLECPNCKRRYMDYWSLHEAIEKAWQNQTEVE